MRRVMVRWRFLRFRRLENRLGQTFPAPRGYLCHSGCFGVEYRRTATDNRDSEENQEKVRGESEQQ